MNSVHTMQCEVCRVGAPQVTDDEAEAFLREIPEWEIAEKGGVKKLKRGYTFKDFAGALAFTNKVGELAESEGHHPVITTTWGKVTLTWYTHKIKGLHQNDFIMAARSDRLG